MDVAATPDFSTAVTAVLDYVRGELGFEMALVSCKEGEDYLVLRVEDDHYGIRAGDVSPWQATLCARMVEGQAPNLAPDIAEHPAYVAAAAALGMDVGAYLTYPLRDARGGVVGTVCAASPTTRDASLLAADRQLRLLTDMLACVLHAERQLQDEARRAEHATVEAEIDALTGLGNRRLWDRVLPAEEERCRRYGLTAVVVVADLDGLKARNDAFGHAAGDLLLRDVALQLQRVVRDTDVVARLGGGEFGVLLTDCGPGAADGLVARLLGQLSEADAPVSLGWAVRRPGGSLAQAWAEADAAMTGNKQSRRTGAAEPAVGRCTRPILALIDDDTREDVGALLHLARAHLGMPMALINRVEAARQTVEHVDSAGPPTIRPGATLPVDDSLCRRVLRGELPAVIPSTLDRLDCAAMEITRTLDIGAYVGVPLRLPDGSVYGTLCCFGPAARHDLQERDAAFLATIAEAIGRRLDRHHGEQRDRHRIVAALDEVVEGGCIEMAFQPIVELATGAVTGYEALARFRTEPYRSPDRWFADAARVGMGTDLQHRAVRLALTALPRFAGLLAINVSPAAVVDPRFRTLFDDVPLNRVILELTEHEAIGDYAALHAALGPLRARGARLAVDDVGAGVANLSHVVRLAPDTVKLDRGLVDGIADDPARQAMAAAMATFATRTGAEAVAEGIEAEADRLTVAELGVAFGQGWLLGRPGPLPAVTAAADASGARPPS